MRSHTIALTAVFFGLVASTSSGQQQLWNTTESSPGTQFTTESGRGVYNGRVVQDREVADDFLVNGLVTRVVSYGGIFCFPQTITGAHVRFYQWTDSGPGALQAEYFLATGDPGLAMYAPCPSILDITLPSPFQASGWHFIAVQLESASGAVYWTPIEADEGPLNNATVYSRDNLAGGVWQIDSEWAGDGLSDMQVELYGFAAPLIAAIEPASVTRSNRVVITGSSFGSDPASTTVLIDGLSAIVSKVLGNEIHAYVPEESSLGTVQVQVVTAEGAGNTAPLTIIPRVPDGRVLWQFQTDDRPAWFQYVGVGPDTRVYVSDQAGLYALTAAGALLWFVPDVGSGRPIDFGVDGTIYTGGPFSSPPLVVALSPDGTILWEFNGPNTQFGAPMACGPNVGLDGNIYAVQDTSTDPVEGLGAFSLDPAGKLRWSNLGSPMLIDYTASNMAAKFGPDRVFVGYEDVDSPHTPTWVFTLDGDQLWFSGQLPSFGGNPPLLDPFGRLILRRGQTGVRAITPDGVQDWFRYHPGQPNFLQRPAVDSLGNIYTGDLVGIELWSLDPQGNTRWVLPSTPDSGIGEALGVAPGDEVLVVHGGSGTITKWIRGYSTAAGELIWQVDLPPENGMSQSPFMVEPAFAADGEVVYMSTMFAGDVNDFGYLYAIDVTPDGPSPASGDLNGDGVVSSADQMLFCSAIGSSVGQPQYLAVADLNDDTTIDEIDKQMFDDILPLCAGDVATGATFAPPADGIVDAADLAYLLGAWGAQPSCADFVSSRTFAAPPDGVVDAADLAFLLGEWGSCD